jgi:hypothetical protein
VQQNPEPGQAPAAGRPDAADREPELVRDLGVGRRRVGHQHVEHALPAHRQPGHRLADLLRAFFQQQALVDLRAGRDRALQHVLVFGQDHPLAVGQAAQALVPGRGSQPRADPVRFLDLVNVLQQPQPRHLGDIGGVAFHQLEVPGDGPDQSRVLINQAFPGPALAGRGAPYEIYHVQAGVVRPARSHPASGRLPFSGGGGRNESGNQHVSGRTFRARRPGIGLGASDRTAWQAALLTREYTESALHVTIRPAGTIVIIP